MRSSQSLGVRFLLCLGFFCLLPASSVLAGGSEPVLEQTLSRALVVSEPRMLVSTLRGWKKPLTPEDITALRAFVEEQRTKDWALSCLGRRLLRQSVPDMPRPPEPILKAEELLLSFDEGKLFKDYSAAAQQLVDLGPAVLPSLQEVLASPGPPDRRRLAARALRLLGDREVVPFLRDQALKEATPDIRMDLLLTLLIWEPTKETVEFAARSITGNSMRTYVTWALTFFERSELPQQMKADLIFALHAQLAPERQSPTIAALGRLDTPEAYAVLADLARQEVRVPEEREDDHFAYAVRALSGLKRSDPTPILLELAPTAPLGSFSPGLLRLVRDGRKELIPVLQARQKDTGEQLERLAVDSDAKLAKLARETALSGIHQEAVGTENTRWRFQEAVGKADADKAKLQRNAVRLAGALAGLGVDYEVNAALVRDNLADPACGWAAFDVVPLLKDEKTIALLCHMIETEETPAVQEFEGRERMERLEYLDGLLGSAIRAVGEMGALEAHDALIKAFEKGGVRLCDPVGRALSSIGKKSSSPDLELEGEDIIAVGQAYGHFRQPRARATMAGSPEAERDRKLLERAREGAERRPYLRECFPPKTEPMSSPHDLLFRKVEKARPLTVVPAEPRGDTKEPGQAPGQQGEER